MSILYDLLARLCQLLFFITSWLVQGLTFIFCSLQPPLPSSELPVASQLNPLPLDGLSPILIGSHVTMDELFTPGPPKQLNLPRTTLSRREQDARKNTHAKKSKPHDIDGSPLVADSMDHTRKVEYQLSVNSSEAADSLASCPPSPTPSVYFTPTLSTSVATSPSTSLCPSLTEARHVTSRLYQYGERVPISNDSVGIGDLGKRRGFKGAPLFTQTTSKSSFLPLPTPSPRSGSPGFAQRTTPRSPSSSPRTPFAAMTNLMRSASPKCSEPINDVSHDLQDFYGDADPFATHGETFFTPSFSFGIVFTANLDNFAPYYQQKPTHRRMPPLKRKLSYEDLRSAASSINKVLMKTTIYDMAVSVDLPSALASGKRKLKSSTPRSFSSGCLSPKIMLTSPSTLSSSARMVSTVTNALPTVIPEVLEASARLQVPTTHTRSSKVRTKLKGNLYEGEATSRGSPEQYSTETNVYDPEMNVPTATAIQTSRDCSDNTLAGVTLSDIKNNQDDHGIPPGAGPSPLGFVPTVNLYELSSYGSPVKDSSLGHNYAHADSPKAMPTKLRKQPMKVGMKVHHLAIYNEAADLCWPEICPATRAAAHPTPISVISCAQTTSPGMDSRDGKPTSSPDYHPSDVGNSVRDRSSKSLNEIIAQLDATIPRPQGRGYSVVMDVPDGTGGGYLSYAI